MNSGMSSTPGIDMQELSKWLITGPFDYQKITPDLMVSLAPQGWAAFVLTTMVWQEQGKEVVSIGCLSAIDRYIRQGKKSALEVRRQRESNQYKRPTVIIEGSHVPDIVTASDEPFISIDIVADGLASSVGEVDEFWEGDTWIRWLIYDPYASFDAITVFAGPAEQTDFQYEYDTLEETGNQYDLKVSSETYQVWATDKGLSPKTVSARLSERARWSRLFETLAPLQTSKSAQLDLAVAQELMAGRQIDQNDLAKRFGLSKKSVSRSVATGRKAWKSIS